MNPQVPATISPSQKVAASDRAKQAAAIRGRLYLTFILGGEMFAIEIQRIREIIEYIQPTVVPMMPPALRGVINVRGGVVPVIDLAVRFNWTPTGIGRRTSIVIIETLYNEQKHMLGLVVDRVNAVTEIKAEDIEPAPVFGARIDSDFISGMAKCDGRFVIVLNIEKTLSVQELAAVASASIE